MRQRSGCKACRERHIKCVKLRDSEKCKYCTQRKRPCIRGNAFRFRAVKAVKFNAGEAIGSAEQSLEFRNGQVWVDIPKSIHFVAPNTDGDDDDFDFEADAQVNTPSIVANAVDTAANNTQLPNDDLTDLVAEKPLTPYHDQITFPDISLSVFDNTPYLPSIHDVLGAQTSPPQTASNRSPGLLQDQRTLSSAGQAANTSTWETTSPTDQQPLHSPNIPRKSPFASNSELALSPYNCSTFTPSSTSLSLKWPVNSAYEARLFSHYIVHCTNWIDVCDARRHFAKEVPKRAAHFTVILNGILGLAARHMWLMGKVEKDWSEPYVDQCLQALILALEDPLAHWDENFLIAVILLRLHEEMGETKEDRCHHNFGTARILNSISSFAADGGLRESASWVSLRQHIYVSLTTQQPLHLSLDNYRHSSVFREFDDESWANRIIFLFATILEAVFQDSSTNTGISHTKWQELTDTVDEWERTKPWTFSALHVEPGAGDKFDGSWPELLCAQGVIAVGLQYYHLCKILLTIYSPTAAVVGIAGIRARRATDAMIRKHIRITIGYGMSNSYCGNAMFQGSHILSAAGAYVIDEKEQQACVEYLQGLQRLIGWRTDGVLRDLKDMWAT